MTRIPAYLKLSAILIGFVAFFFIMYAASDIIVPLLFSMIIAILMNPVVNFFQRKRIGKVPAISLALFLAILVVGLVLFLIGAQISRFGEALPSLISKLNTFLDEAVNYLATKFDIPPVKLNEWISNTTKAGINGSGGKVGQTLSGISSVMVIIFLVPMYIFLFLYYKPLLLMFIVKLFGEKSESTVEEVLKSTKTLIQKYLVGVLLEVLIISVLDTVALLIIGVDFAVPLGIIGGLLNLIPYVGPAVGVVLPMLIALLSGTGMSSISVLVAYTIIQVFDNNFIVPLVVASKVQVNALISIVVVIIGGALWGAAGMFMAIPLIAIVKVLCDNIPMLSAFGLLIGDEMPKTNLYHHLRSEEKNSKKE